MFDVVTNGSVSTGVVPGMTCCAGQGKFAMVTN